jgi:glycosyltransferase involved in cell wall biosynthesis
LVLAALQQLRKEFPQLKFVMVGQGDLGRRAQALIRRFGLEGSVIQTGWVPSKAYLDYIDLADVVIDLRYPTAGETSGSSLRAMQAAKPLIVSAEGFFLELPDDCCTRLPVGDPEQEVQALREALERLIRDPATPKMGMAGRQFALANLRIEQAARSYMELIREVAASSYPPARTWNFDGRGFSVGSQLIAWAYRAGRLVYSCKSYGLAATLQRVKSAWRAKNP